jgi:hypothetical protein
MSKRVGAKDSPLCATYYMFDPWANAWEDAPKSPAPTATWATDTQAASDAIQEPPTDTIEQVVASTSSWEPEPPSQHDWQTPPTSWTDSSAPWEAKTDAPSFPVVDEDNIIQTDSQLPPQEVLPSPLPESLDITTRTRSPSPDAFGSFETGDQEFSVPSWGAEPSPPSLPVDEPPQWGSAWSDSRSPREPEQDEWSVAQARQLEKERRVVSSVDFSSGSHLLRPLSLQSCSIRY